jgi:signal peptidase I
VSEDTLSEAAPPASPESDPSRGAHRRRLIVEWTIIVVVAVVISLLMRTFVLQTFYIPSASMEPTLQIGDRIIVSKLSVELGSIHRGDIVVFRAPPAEHCGDPVSDLVKRVIGVPGDTLYSDMNKIFYKNASTHGKYVQLRETWSHREPLGSPVTQVTLKANQYFVMGDNHPDSCDSRYWGPVTRSEIVGKVFLRIWPLGRLSFL